MSIDILQSIILGAVQGLTEFLPVSSTAHLVLTPYFFSWEDPGLAFDVALHLGTLIAVLAYFWKDWILILNIFLKKMHCPLRCILKTSDEKNIYPDNFVDILIIATIPGGIVGYFLNSYVETIFRSPLLIAFNLAFFGLVLFLFDKYFTKKRSLKSLNFKDALIIGFSQALAIIPGISRSGATMTAALGLNFTRKSATRFSFLLSMPIILGAVLSQMPDILSVNLNFSLIAGIIVSAVSGYLAIKYMLALIQKISYRVFFWYRLVLAVLIVAVYFIV